MFLPINYYILFCCCFQDKMQLKLKMYCLQQLTNHIDQTFTLSIRMSESGENLASTWYLESICKVVNMLAVYLVACLVAKDVS